MQKHIISTPNAPAAIGTYSQGVSINNGVQVYLSGQIPLDPVTMQIVAGDISAQIHQVFKNLAAVCEAAGGKLDNIVKLNVYLTDLNNFAAVNEIQATYFKKPYPARAALGVNQLPKNVAIEIDAVMVVRADYQY